MIIFDSSEAAKYSGDILTLFSTGSAIRKSLNPFNCSIAPGCVREALRKAPVQYRMAHALGLEFHFLNALSRHFMKLASSGELFRNRVKYWMKTMSG